MTRKRVQTYKETGRTMTEDSQRMLNWMVSVKIIADGAGSDGAANRRTHLFFGTTHLNGPDVPYQANSRGFFSSRPIHEYAPVVHCGRPTPELASTPCALDSIDRLAEIFTSRQEDARMLSVLCSPGRYKQGGVTIALGRPMKSPRLEGPVLLIAGRTVIGRLPRYERSWPGMAKTSGPLNSQRLVRFGISASLRLTWSLFGAVKWYQNSSRTVQSDRRPLLSMSCSP